MPSVASCNGKKKANLYLRVINAPQITLLALNPFSLNELALCSSTTAVHKHLLEISQAPRESSMNKISQEIPR